VAVSEPPVLRAYLVQTGDLTRPVYIASLRLVVSTGLWVWVSELASRRDDEATGRSTKVRLSSPRLSARCGTLMLVLLLFGAIIGPVLNRSSLPPLSLVAILSSGPALAVLRVAWNEYASETRMMMARQVALLVHGALCAVISAASLTVCF
jgi:1,4-dihydroxy-2-naphthoate octaprenyltransferase